MAKRIQDYEINPDFPTPGLPRIQQLQRLKTQGYTTPAEQRELKRLEETQQTIEFLYHRGKRNAAKRKPKTS
jgi:hypothetical protein